MNRITLSIALVLLVLLASGVMAQWDNHKMHFPQLPDESGWGITSRLTKILADDWQCSESGPVRDLHFWGKWLFGIEGTIDNFEILVYADIPADPPSVPFSRPGALLWQFTANNFTETRFSRTSPGGWYSPGTGEDLVDVQQDYFQYDIYFDDPQTWFEQVEGTIYWIQIACEWSVTGEWGWMSSLNNWNDNAVYWRPYTGELIELYEPGSSDPLDFAFVITADASATDEGACCYPDPTGSGDMLCKIATQAYCENNLLGTYRGDGTQCQPPEACCLPNGECVMADPTCCETILLGAPMGEGSACTDLQACCFDDGSCMDLDPLCCLEMGGYNIGPGTNCASTDCNQMPKIWHQSPDRSEKVMSVNATLESSVVGPDLTYVLADDFLCTKTEPITEIHIWGSWLADMYTLDDPGNVIFHISIHSDIPAGELAEWSMPGPILMDWFIGPEEFRYNATDLTGNVMGWLDPPEEWLPIGYNFEYEYIFRFDETEWFIQQGSEQSPVIYWLDVQAIVPDGSNTLFGWKTSDEHWNDNAVYFMGEDAYQQLPWTEMVLPPDHPFAPDDIDMAFLISGPCDCEPGDADGVVPVNILDVVHLINFKYKDGPIPIPYELCSGDFDCDCTVNILDVVSIINYKYKGGPPPCGCRDFLDICGPPLR